MPSPARRAATFLQTFFNLITRNQGLTSYRNPQGIKSATIHELLHHSCDQELRFNVGETGKLRSRVYFVCQVPRLCQMLSLTSGPIYESISDHHGPVEWKEDSQRGYFKREQRARNRSLCSHHASLICGPSGELNRLGNKKIHKACNELTDTSTTLKIRTHRPS